METSCYAPLRMPSAAPIRLDMVHTRDVEEARQWGVKVFCESRLSKADNRNAIDARLSYRRLRGIGVGHITYGGNVTIDPGSLDSFFLIQVPLSGQELVQSGKESVCSTPRIGTVINPQSPVLIQHHPDTEKLVVRIERDVLERNCLQHLGRPMRNGLAFRPSMDLETSAGMRWARMVKWLHETLSVDDDGTESPIVSAQIEQMVISMLLTSQESNYSEELAGEDRSIAPSFIKRIERYIEEHAEDPITIVDLAEHAGVSSRSIFNGFRHFRNTSPMLYLKEVRMRRVNEELTRLKTGEATVTSIAYRWGFSHLGHFTTDYKRRFGESPSQTLAR